MLEKLLANERKDRVAEVTVKRRHSGQGYAVQETVFHGDVEPYPKLCKELGPRREVIPASGIPHDHVSAAGGSDAPDQRCAMASPADINDASAFRSGNRLRSVRTAIVRDQYLADNGVAFEKLARLTNARGEGFRLIQARHEDGKVDFVAHGMECIEVAH